MKKFLLTVAVAALAAGPVSAQIQMKAIAPVAKQSSYFPKGELKLGEKTLAVPIRDSREGEQMDPKVLTNTPGWDLNVYEAAMNGQAGVTMKIATMYDPSLQGRFDGNRIKEIKILGGPNMKNFKGFIIDAQTGEVVWEGKTLPSLNNTTSKSKKITFKCDYTLDKKTPVIVGYEATMKSNSTSIGVTGNVVSNGLLLDVVGDEQEGFVDLSVANGIVAYIDCVTEGEAGLKANDVEVLDISSGRVEANGEYSAIATFINYGTNPISKVSSTYVINEKESKSDVAGEQPFPYMTPVQLEVPGVAPEVGARYLHEFTVDKINDVNDEYNEVGVFSGKPDNSAYGVITSFEVPYLRNIVMEEFTATWCGWCPRGHVAMEKAEKALGNRFIGVAVHVNDDMECKEYLPLAQLSGGLPSAMVNRIGYNAVDPYYGMQGPATEEGQEDGDIMDDLQFLSSLPVEAQLGLSSDYAEDGSIEVTGMVKFGLNAAGKTYSLAYTLVEDGITGYAQSNYFHQSAGKVSSVDMLPEDLKFLFSEGKNAKYLPTYNNVARSIKDVAGIAGSLDNIEIEKGKTYTHVYNIPVPASVKNKENLRIIVMLIDNLTGEIVTGQDAKIGEMVWDETAGVEEVVADKAEISVVNGAIQVSGNGKAAVYTVDGKLVESVAVNGSATLPTAGMKGVYVVRVVNGSNITVKKVLF